MGEKRLTSKEREFATKYHGVIYAFLNANDLTEADYYDVAALGYLRAVMRYNREPKLRQYSFTTVAWQAMRSNVGNKKKSDKLRDTLIAYSLNELTEDGTEYGDFVQDAKDSFSEIFQQGDMEELMQRVMPVLTEQQRSHLMAKLEGYRPQEIMKQQHKSVQDYNKDLGEIKAAVLSIVGCSISGGAECRQYIDREDKHMGKTTITVTQGDMTQTFDGDTVLAFTVDHKNLSEVTPKVINANAVYMGSDIPDELFPELIGSLVASFIKKRGAENGDCLLHTAFVLDEVSKVIKAFSKDICDNVSKEDMEKELKEQVHKMADDILQHIFEEVNKE